MKKIITLCVSLAVFTAAHSQFRLGVKGGLNLANEKFKVSMMGTGGSKTGDMIASYQVGLISDVQLTNAFHFRPELILSSKGTNMSGLDFDTDGSGTGEEGKAKLRPTYVELPLNFVYYYKGKGANIYIGGGPALSFGAFGKVKGGGQEENIFDNPGFKRFELGLSLVGGIDLPGGFTAGLHMNQALTKAMNETIEETGFGKATMSVTNFVFGVSVGYFFKK